MKATPAAESSASSGVPSSTATPPPSTVQPTATWPEWFYSVDVALTVLAIAAAFLMTAHAARNSDVWLSLASGRHLAQGNWPSATDPFSHSAAERPLLQSSWLYDLLSYAGYSLATSGVVLIAIKATVFMLAMVLPLCLRRPGQALWPWAMMILCGSLAVGPFVGLRSISVSTLFLSVTLLLLYRQDWSVGGWKKPLILGAIFALWANLDAWCWLGPVTVALVLLGQWMDRFLGISSDDDPLPQEPATPQLLRALLIGLAACLLNPSFFAGLMKGPDEIIPQLLPIELKLGLSDNIAKDSEFEFLVRTPLSSEHFQSRQRGQNWNGLAFLVLLIVTTGILAVGFRRLRSTHILLFVVFAALALNHTRLMIFLPIVAIPLIGSFWNSISSRLKLGTWTEPNTRIFVTVSVLKRVLSLVLAFVVVASVYPGWVQPGMIDPAVQNRLEFRVIPDQGLLRTATRLQAIRAEVPLPADLRGLNTSATLGDYLAFFAPEEKAYINSRFRFHQPELEQVLSIRRELYDRLRPAESIASVPRVAEILTQAKCGYFTLSSYYVQVQLDQAVREMVIKPKEWQVWHLDGRSAILAPVTPAVQALKADKILTNYVLGQAYGSAVDRLPVGPLTPPPTTEELPFWENYFDRPTAAPVGSDDVAVWDGYLQLLKLEKEYRFQQQAEELQLLTGVRMGLVGTAAGISLFVPPPPIPREDVEFALPVLMTRAARQAVAEAPDRPNGYLALARAYRQQLAPVSDISLGLLSMDERTYQLICARARLLSRILPPGASRDFVPMLTGFLQSLYQMEAFRQTGQLDLAAQSFRKALEYMEYLTPFELIYSMQEFTNQNFQPPQDAKGLEELVKQIRKQLETERDNLSRQVQLQSDNIKRIPNKGQRYFNLLQSGLPGEALALYEELKPEDFRELDIEAALARQQTLLRSGQLERCNIELEALEEALKQRRDLSREKNNPAEAQRCDDALERLRLLKAVLARAAGNPASTVDLEGQVPLPSVPAELVQPAAQVGANFVGLTALAGSVAGLVELTSDQFPWPRELADRRPNTRTRYLLWFGPGGNQEPIPSNRAWPMPTPPQLVSLHIVAGGPAFWTFLSDAQNPNAKFSDHIAELFRVRELLQFEAQFQFDRAMLALVDGNLVESERRLKLAASPQGAELGRLGDLSRAGLIAKYLELFARGQAKSKPSAE